MYFFIVVLIEEDYCVLFDYYELSLFSYTSIEVFNITHSIQR